MAIVKCVWVRVLVDVSKSLLRWTSVSFGGVSSKVLLRYEKLVDFCYLCGQLDHLEKNCALLHPEALRYYGTWLRANSLNTLSWNEVVSDLNWLNSNKNSPGTSAASPRTPIHKGLPLPTAGNEIVPSKTRPTCASSPIPIHGLNNNPNTPSSVGSNKGTLSSIPPNDVKPD